MSGSHGRRVLCMAALLLTVGCGWGQRKTYTRDPILRDQQPGSPMMSMVPQSTPVEPTAPPRPILPTEEAAIASGPTGGIINPVEAPAALDGPGLPIQPIPSPELITKELEKPVLEPMKNLETAFAQDAVMSTSLSNAARAASLETPRRILASVPGKYAHDSDYRRLKGVIDRNSHGLYLRYCDLSVEDPWGGKVHLEDARFAELRDGTEIEVEGDLIPPKQGSMERFPGYKVTKLIQ